MNWKLVIIPGEPKSRKNEYHEEKEDEGFAHDRVVAL